MSTRCNIIIKTRWNKRIYLYHHHDGYPEGVGALLADYLGEMKPWQIKQNPIEIANHLVKHGIPYMGRDWKTGEPKERVDDEYEITTGIHGDIEYLYVLNCKAGSLHCYAVGWDDQNDTFEVDLGKVLHRDHLCRIPGWDYVPDAENPESAA